MHLMHFQFLKQTPFYPVLKDPKQSDTNKHMTVLRVANSGSRTGGQLTGCTMTVRKHDMVR